jgi:D-amino peptidase
VLNDESDDVVNMRILIWDDIEGIAGIDDPEHGFDDDTYKQLITREINTVISGLVKAGAKEIDIFDGHGMGNNVILEDLNPIANYLGGGWITTLTELIKKKKLGQYNALVLVGVHAQAGTVDGFIAHTNSSFTALRMNSQPIGEIEQAGWLAGHFGVPLIFVSGDEAAVKEAIHFFPEIETVSVKKKEQDAFVCRPVEEVYEETEEKAFKALSRLKEFDPHTCGEPITVEILFGLEELAQRLVIIPGYDKKDERTIIYQAEDYLEAFWAFHGFRPILSSLMGDFYHRALKRVVEEYNLDSDNLNLILKDIKDEMLTGRLSFPEIKF